MRRARLIALGCMALAAASTPVVAAEAVDEIRALIARVAASDCRFFRNGEWHDSEAAADHMARKLRVARFMGRTGTAEDFIEQAGTRSSVSGEPYRVQCGDAKPRASAAWLEQLLRAVRQAQDEASTTK